MLLQIASGGYFENLEPLLRTFWYLAIPVSLVFLIQTVLTFLGMDSSDGLEADFSGEFADVEAPFQLFSLRNLINFLLGFSWSGIALYWTIPNHNILVLVAFLIGSTMVYVFLVIMREIQKLAEDNTFKLDEAIDQQGEVYLPIPADKAGAGKVLISVKGTTHELPAITRGAKLPTGKLVRVTEIVNHKYLLVEPL